MCSTYREVTLLNLPGKIDSGVLEKKAQSVVEPQVQEEQSRFVLAVVH